MNRDQMTPQKAALIKRLLLSTSLHQHEIAAVARCNQGRVSEIKQSKRFADVEPLDEVPQEMLPH